MNIPSSPTKFKGRNPIATDSALGELLEQTKDFQSEDDFKGWQQSFLDVYTTYLDPAGVENAHASDDRLVRSLEKLASTVVSVNTLVDDKKITVESQTVMGKRALTNMTDQMAKAEKEIQRFMPATGADEAIVGYDKFELAAVMIEDGFHVYEILKTTKDIICHLQDTVLNDVLPGNKLSIIQFYLRQIQSFCDVMADLGLFGLMEDVMEMYKVKPRSKAKPTKDSPKAPRKLVETKQKLKELPEPEEPQVVELDPDKIYNFRSSFEGGYIDPFSGTAPGSSSNEKDDEKNEEEGEGEEEFIIYFDMKTGVIGKIPRMACASKGVIVTEDGGFEGEIDDQDEKEDLLWKMKKAMKTGGKPGKPKRSGCMSKSPSQKKYVVTPGKDTKRRIGRSKSGDGKNGSNLRGLGAPKLFDDDGNDGVDAAGDDVNDVLPSSARVKRDPPKKRVPPGKSKSFDSSFHYNKEESKDKKPAPFVGMKLKKRDSNVSATGSNGKDEQALAASPRTKKKTISKSPTTSRKNSVSSAASSSSSPKPRPKAPVSSSSSPKMSPRTAAKPKRKSSQKVVKNPKPSSSGWATASSMAESRAAKKAQQ